jgi:hypothetical protein
VDILYILLPFDAIGAAMAFLISYDELQRHCPDRRAALSEALRRAPTTLVFLLLLSATVTFILARAGP